MIAVYMFIAVSFAFSQTKAEQELLKFNSDYEQAQINRDVAFFERGLADEYTFSGPTAEVENKAKAIAWLRAEKEKPTYKIVSMRSEDVKAKVMGNMGILTGTWVFASRPVNDDAGETHTDKGRYTAFLEKRNGQWLVIAEHVSEAPHDRKVMEQEVMKIGLKSAQMFKDRDFSGMERIVADDAFFINPTGKIKTKAEISAEVKNSGAKIEAVEITDQKVRITGNSSAIETGIVRYKGADKTGRPFDETERYTTTWVWRNGRWQIASDHTSTVKP